MEVLDGAGGHSGEMDVVAGADRGPGVSHQAAHGPPQADPLEQGLRPAGWRQPAAMGDGDTLVADHRQRLPRPAPRQLAPVGEGDGRPGRRQRRLLPPGLPVPMFEN